MLRFCRRRSAESKLSDAELQVEALESKLTSLSQLLESEQAAAESALKASEQSWQVLLDEATAAAASHASSAAQQEAQAVQSDLQQQLEESKAAHEVRTNDTTFHSCTSHESNGCQSESYHQNIASLGRVLLTAT